MDEEQISRGATAPEAVQLNAETLGRFFLHELRQPLTAAKAAVQLARSDNHLDGLGDLDLLDVQLQRIEELANSFDVLLRGSTTHGRIDVGAVIHRALDLQRGPQWRVPVAVHVPTGLTAWGSASALSHAVTNLLQNAAEAVSAKRADDSGRIWVDACRREADIVLRVADNGVGIASGVLRNIFEVGSTSKSHEEGHGLGLALSRELIRRSGGTLQVCTPANPAATTEFAITLPAVPGEDPSRAGEPTRVCSCAVGPMKVLVVDDELVVLRMLERFLRRQGYAVLATTDGVEALELINTERLDILLTDKNLGGMSGMTLIEAAQRQQPPPWSILITGYASSRLTEQTSRLGIAATLTKPFELRDLQAAMENISRVRA